MARVRWEDHVFQVKLQHGAGARKCWRLVRVPGRMGLFTFQQVILRAFGLGDNARHYFKQGRETYVPDGVYIKGNSRGEMDWDLCHLLDDVGRKGKFRFETGEPGESEELGETVEVVFTLEAAFRPDEGELRSECSGGCGWLPVAEPKRRAGATADPGAITESEMKKINREIREVTKWYEKPRQA